MPRLPAQTGNGHCFSFKNLHFCDGDASFLGACQQVQIGFGFRPQPAKMAASSRLIQRSAVLGMTRLDETRPFISLGIAVLTVSDTRSLADDRSGDALTERLTKVGHRLAARALARDDVDDIREQVRAWIADPAVDVILTTGGTGFTGRDVTPEAVEPLFDKRMDGFSVVFHQLSYEKIGVSTIQSRATAGLAGSTFVFVLPGSPGACKDAWDGVLAHQLDYRSRPCNFVEIMPRLDEHLRRGAV